MGEPLRRVHAMQLTGSQQRVDHRSPLSRFVRAGEQVVLAAQGQRTDCILHKIIINLKDSIVQVSR